MHSDSRIKTLENTFSDLKELTHKIKEITHQKADLELLQKHETIGT
jgi:hypothetical protein